MLSTRQENSAKHEGQPKKKQQLRCMCCSRIVSTRMFTSASIHSFTYTYTDTPFDIAQVAKAWESQVAKGYMVPWCSGITSVLKHAENLDVNICYICYRCLHCIYNWIYTKHLLDVSCFWKRTNIYQQLSLILLLWLGFWVCGVLHCESNRKKGCKRSVILGTCFILPSLFNNIFVTHTVILHFNDKAYYVLENEDEPVSDS